MRSNEYRIEQRERHIHNRLRQWKNIHKDSIFYETVIENPGKLDRHSLFMCPDGRKCMVCHPHKQGGAYRIPTKQEELNSLELLEETNYDD